MKECNYDYPYWCYRKDESGNQIAMKIYQLKYRLAVDYGFDADRCRCSSLEEILATRLEGVGWRFSDDYFPIGVNRQQIYSSIDEKGAAHIYFKDNKLDGKPSRIISKMYAIMFGNNMSENEKQAISRIAEEFGDSVKKQSLLLDGEEVVIDKDFRAIYNGCSSDFGSCMQNGEGWRFYKENEYTCSAASLRNESGEILARCIVWNCSDINGIKHVLSDRIYGRDLQSKFRLANYLNNNVCDLYRGWLMDSCSASRKIYDKDGKPFESELIVALDWNEMIIPYMDTFKSTNDGEIWSNLYDGKFCADKTYVHVDECPRCGLPKWQGEECGSCGYTGVRCWDCGDLTADENLYNVIDENGYERLVCVSCLENYYVWVESQNAYYHQDNRSIRYVEKYEDYFLIDDLIEVNILDGNRCETFWDLRDRFDSSEYEEDGYLVKDFKIPSKAFREAWIYKDGEEMMVISKLLHHSQYPLVMEIGFGIYCFSSIDSKDRDIYHPIDYHEVIWVNDDSILWRYMDWRKLLSDVVSAMSDARGYISFLENFKGLIDKREI